MTLRTFAGTLRVAALALSLSACAELLPEEKLPPAQEAQSVTLTKQQNGRFIAFVGPKQQHSEPFLGVSETNYFALRSWLDNKTNDSAHQLYVEKSYFGSPHLWNGALDGDNKALKFIPISRNEITCELGCSYADEFAASLSEDYLRAHKGGFAVTFTESQGRNLGVAVPGSMVTAELAALDDVRGTIAKAAAKTPPAVAQPAAAEPAPAAQK